MKHIKSYKLFENNQQIIDEFFSVMQGTPEGNDFMKWFVADPKRTGRIYITPKNGTGVFIPSVTYFNKEYNGHWSYRYVSSGNEYGERYGDLKSLFRRFIVDSIIKSIPKGIKKSEIEDFFLKDPITPGTLPDKLQPLIDFFYQSKRTGLVRDMGFLRDIPWIKMVTDLEIYKIKEGGGVLTVDYQVYTRNIDRLIGITEELEKLFSDLRISFSIRNSLAGISFFPGRVGKKRTKLEYHGGISYHFYFGYQTEAEIENIAVKEIDKILEKELSCEVVLIEDRKNKVNIPFMGENLKHFIRNGGDLPGYEEEFYNFIAGIISEKIANDFTKMSLLKGGIKDDKKLMNALKLKRPDIFDKPEEDIGNLIKGASALKRFGALGDD